MLQVFFGGDLSEGQKVEDTAQFAPQRELQFLQQIAAGMTARTDKDGALAEFDREVAPLVQDFVLEQGRAHRQENGAIGTHFAQTNIFEMSNFNFLDGVDQDAFDAVALADEERADIEFGRNARFAVLGWMG